MEGKCLPSCSFSGRWNWGGITFDTATEQSNYIHRDLQKFGFIKAEDKCTWVLYQSITWLGYVWNTLDGYIDVTQFLYRENYWGQLIFPVRKVACLVGQFNFNARCYRA